jgi:hypothetical protein
MRNPMNSWERSDSISQKIRNTSVVSPKNTVLSECFYLGVKDKELSQKLCFSGGEHSKHLRIIQVWCDMTLPRYVWQEFDTYGHINKVSTSTMHKLTSQPLDNTSFEYPISQDFLDSLNAMIETYKNTKDKNDFYILKNALPEGFLQKRTINANYQTLLNIYNQRKDHKLEQWHKICDFILGLPYFIEFTGVEVKNA